MLQNEYLVGESRLLYSRERAAQSFYDGVSNPPTPAERVWSPIWKWGTTSAESWCGFAFGNGGPQVPRVGVVPHLEMGDHNLSRPREKKSTSVLSDQENFVSAPRGDM